MDYCDHCGKDITYSPWFFAKESDSQPDSRICKECNIKFLKECAGELEESAYYDEQEKYERMSEELRETADQMYINLTGHDRIINKALYEELSEIAHQCVCIRYN